MNTKLCTNGKNELEMHNVFQSLVTKQIKEGYEKQMDLRPFPHYCGGYSGQQHWGGTVGAS